MSKKEKNTKLKNKDNEDVQSDELNPDQILAELKEYKDKYIRLYADFENTRKRMEREKLEFVKFANEGLIYDLIKILDDFERCIAAARSDKHDNDALLKGVEMVAVHFHDMIKKNGVTVIEAKGKKFDPHFHEILVQEETDEFEESLVLEELEKGYMYNDKVLRTVKVKIAKKIENKENNENLENKNKENSETTDNKN